MRASLSRRHSKRKQGTRAGSRHHIPLPFVQSHRLIQRLLRFVHQTSHLENFAQCERHGGDLIQAIGSLPKQRFASPTLPMA